MEKQINTIHAYKYDGTLYRVWNEIKILQETNESVCVQMQDSIIKTLKHNNFFANRVNYPSICYFYKNE
jgi:protein associated with RNAse G/E